MKKAMTKKSKSEFTEFIKLFLLNRKKGALEISMLGWFILGLIALLLVLGFLIAFKSSASNSFSGITGRLG